MQPTTMPSALRHSVLVWQELHFAADTKMAATSAAAPARKSKKAMQPLRPKGKPATKMNRIIAEMRGMDRTELCEMKLKAMQHQFGAAASTCKKARDTVRG
jgi:hypothetical protein